MPVTRARGATLVLHARTVQSHGSHGAMRSEGRGGRHQARGDCDGGSRTRSSAVAASSCCGRTASRSTVGILEADARRQNAPFLTRMGRGRPHVTMKVALSADGMVALAGGHATRLTGDVANRRIHRDRAEVDAIAIGSGTLLDDDPLLTARIAYRRRPFIRVIFDRRLRTPPAARVLSTLESGPVIIVTDADASASQEPLHRLDQGGRECGGHLARRLDVRGRRAPPSHANRCVLGHSGGRPHDPQCVLGPRPRGSRPDVRQFRVRLAPTAWDGGRRPTRSWHSSKTFDGPGSEPTC